MPGANITAVGEQPTGDGVPTIERPYRRLSRRFVEAGALAWFKDLDSVLPEVETSWVGSLELCALVTGQLNGLAERLASRRFVITWGNNPHNPLYRLPPYRQALNRAASADLIICMIETAFDHCVALGIPEDRCRVVLPPVDTDFFHPPSRPVEEPVLLFISPLASNKGIDRVLDAFEVVRRRVPDAQLLVAGQGPLAPMVEERASNSGGTIRYLGPLPREGVAELLRTGAVFVTAPRATRVWNEQFGLAYVEAMASGLPVVTTICGSNHEAVLDPSIRVPDDVGSLAEGLVHFLGDPGLRRQVFSQVRDVVVDRFERSQQLAALRGAFDSAR